MRAWNPIALTFAPQAFGLRNVVRDHWKCNSNSIGAFTEDGMLACASRKTL
jgi:hypothetical protein